MYPIDPQQMLAMAYMGTNPEMYDEWEREHATCVDISAPKKRYCVACECSQFSGSLEPCWNCGAEDLTTQKPVWWPNYGQSQTVYTGQSWAYNEEWEEEEA